jgi:multicomponent Na+:H+ antiporter subunit E
MKTTSRRIILLIILTFIWCVLNERFSFSTVIGGLVVSLITFFLLRLIQPDQQKNFTYNISVIRLIIFVFVVFKEIYVSAYRAIKHILKNEINPQFVSTTTSIKRHWLQALIANAITLTPGTVTVHLKDGSYTILWLYPLTIRQKDIKKHLIQVFEDALIKEDRNA